MLQITVPGAEYWDEKTSEFVYKKEQTLQLEHSLVSLSKWEAKWKKPFLGKGDLSTEETLDYVRCMTITKNVPPEVYTRLSSENIRQINEYIDDPMTATTFTEDRHPRRSREIITSELIYYWMIANNIPPEYQKWHLSRLLTLIRVCNRMSNPPKPKSKAEIMRRNAALNASRRAKLGTRG